MSTSRPVIAFALLKQCSEVMRTDLLGGISVLIRPLISDLAGQRFSADLLSKRVSETYGMSIAPNVLEEFIPRFRDAGLVGTRSLSENADEAFFMEVDELKTDPEDEIAFQSVLDEFTKFSENRLANVDWTIPREKLVEGLLSRLTSLDFLSIQVKPQKTDAGNEISKVLGPTAKQEQELDKQIGDEARIDVLVASYINELVVPNAERLALVSRVADGALGAELVFDLQAPKQLSDLSKVTVILDTPLILSLLDLSSLQNREYTEKLVSSIRKVGGKLAAYRHSVEEAEGVLTAVKNGMLYGNAYGPTVERMRSSAYRAFFDTMLGKISQRMTDQHGFEVLAPCANHYYQHFTSEDEEKLTARLHFSLWDKRIARERDALSVAETVRRRGGAHIPQHRIDASKFIFLTSNSSLQSQARQYLMTQGMLAKDEFAPVVTDRYFAGLLWLLFGGKSAEGLSTAKLLANCANALKLRQDVVQRTKRFLNALDPIKAQHFEVLMTSERAAQFMTEITLGDALLVTQENAEKIYEQIEVIAAEKVAKQKDEQYGQQLSQMNEQLVETATLLQDAQSELTQAKLDKDASQEQLKSMTDGLKALEDSFNKQKELAEQQANQYEELTKAFTSVREQQMANENLLKTTRAQQVFVANQRSHQKVNNLRTLGIAIVVASGLAIGYLDKFLVPTLSSNQQALGNVAIIVLQVVLTVTTLGAVIELLFGSLFRSIKSTAFISHLIEFGWTKEEAEKTRDENIGK